jgi:hypothetical protein
VVRLACLGEAICPAAAVKCIAYQFFAGVFFILQAVFFLAFRADVPVAGLRFEALAAFYAFS